MEPVYYQKVPSCVGMMEICLDIYQTRNEDRRWMAYVVYPKWTSSTSNGITTAWDYRDAADPQTAIMLGVLTISYKLDCLIKTGIVNLLENLCMLYLSIANQNGAGYPDWLLREVQTLAGVIHVAQEQKEKLISTAKQQWFPGADFPASLENFIAKLDTHNYGTEENLNIKSMVQDVLRAAGSITIPL